MFRRLSVVVSALLLAAFAAARPPSEDTAGYPRTPDPSPRDPVVDVMKFIPPAIHAGIRAGSNRDDVSRFVQKAIDSCLVETGTQDFAKRGHGPRGRGTVTFPPGTYNVRNILLRSGVDVRIARGATVRLCDNTVDATMRPPYPPSNVFCTTLDHTGNFDDPHFGPQRWFQGSGARKEQVLSPELRAGQYGTQTEFIVEDVRVFGGGTIDGNRGRNTLGDSGANASAMGSCICLHQARNVTVSALTLRSARIDGFSTGYTLHGGTYDSVVERCSIRDSGRNGVSLITGWNNRVVGNIFEGSRGSDVDIEGNWDGEVNARHIVSGNTGTSAVAIAAVAAVRSDGCRIEKNRFGRLHLYPLNAQGTIVERNRFIGNGKNAAVTAGGPGGRYTPVDVRDNVFEGYARPFDGPQGPLEGTRGGLRLKGNVFRER